MEAAKILITLIGVLVWPTLILIVLLTFRTQLRSLIDRVKHFEIAGSKTEFSEAKKQAIIEELTSEVEDIQSSAIINREEKERLVRQVLTERFQNIEQKIESVKVEHHKTANLQDNVKDRTMLAFAVGDSLAENLTYRLYYDPVDRNHNYPFRYIGLYNEKTIKNVGEVVKIVYCDLVDGELVGTRGYDIAKLTPDERERIKGAIQNTSYYDLTKGNKFYLVDAFPETYYFKESQYGIRAKRYFWLDEIPGFRTGMTSAEVSKLLDGKIWY
ncbi:MAG: hypothetical protein V4635_09455 [Bacteroidota bacterium]